MGVIAGIIIFMLGGTTGVTLMCLIQINRDNSKDKIKEKIEELEKRYTEHCYFQYNKKEVLDICINELKELLGDESND